VHWSHGSFGYFPTYSLGSFYGAQFYGTAKTALPGLEEDLSTGKTANLLGWLRKEVHAKGRLYQSEELCQQVSGRGLDVSFFLQYLLHKYTKIYNLST
jgi:carboxypeptidase Taq